jgi:hypothetical protein
MARGLKIGNEYAQQFGRLYAKTPKAVFAAIVWSYSNLVFGEDHKDMHIARFLDEWRNLHDNEILAQDAPNDRS